MKVPELIRKYFPVVRSLEDDPSSFFISMMSPDLEGDVVVPEGGDFSGYLANPIVLYLHDGFGKTGTEGLPIGVTKALEVIPGMGLKAHGIDWLKTPRPPIVDWIQSAWDQKKLRGASIGFISQRTEPNRQTGGRTHKGWRLLEWSIVPLPMHPQALRNSAEETAMILKAYGVDPSLALEIPRPNGGRLFVIDESMKEALRAEERVADDTLPKTDEIVTTLPERKVTVIDEPIRWNEQLSKAFDVARERFEPATVGLGLAAKYLDCDVKDLWSNGDPVMSARMGSFLSALDEKLVDWKVDDVRNLTPDGKEVPPAHDTIRLNSKTRADFLVNGIRFMRGKSAAFKLVLRVTPSWYGLDVHTYADMEHRHEARQFLDDVWARAGELNFLKGEAFSVSGAFIDKTDERWADVFLDAKNEAVFKRTVELINAKGAAMDNRGLMVVGPPGTGKTLAGRVMRNEAKATFIWMSARDFYYMGAFGGIEHAFELAKELAPAILFMEDVDSWITSRTVDMLKTTMDGVARTKGIVTVLTSNFPELMPEALIDRPGRFHDVLKVALPDAEVRARMIERWMPELDAEQRACAVEATDGYSGAHVKELAHFAKTIAEQDGLEPGAALEQAIAKLVEQRELITALQTEGSRYRPRGVTVAALVEKEIDKELTKGTVLSLIRKRIDDTSPGPMLEQKEGRVLSRKNFDRLEAAHREIGAVLEAARKPDPEPAAVAETLLEDAAKMADEVDAVLKAVIAGAAAVK